MMMGPPKMEQGHGGGGGSSGGGGGSGSSDDGWFSGNPPGDSNGNDDREPVEDEPTLDDDPRDDSNGTPGNANGDGPRMDPGYGTGNPGDIEEPGGPPVDQKADPKPDLKGVGTTTYKISKGGTATLASRVENTGDKPTDVTVRWSVGGQQVGRESKNIGPRSTKRFTTTVSYADVRAMGYTDSGQGGRIEATLNGGATWNRQSARDSRLLAKVPTKDKDNSDDSAPSTWAVLPPVGSLTSKQTTAGGALALVVLLGVLK
ncbi:hypothetical protein [Halorussus halophilus]|uniref:hypothetical protein n=1 Tax=Halorussus halophilus TaxID=2650975 RepID=UPI0013012AD5|nr:hypothetical protein [Halorussus halophilus]